MRKRIAVFAGGWGGEYLKEVLSGITEYAFQEDTDVFTFVNFSVQVDDPTVNQAELDFFKLPDISDFDGVILLANSFNSQDELQYLHDAVLASNIPAISVEYEQEGIPCITTDNYSGMYDLTSHIIKEHTAQSIVFIGGPENHAECQIRLNALLDAAKDNSIEIPKENIIYADWGKVLIPPIADEWINAHNGELPDAFVCANDIMALALCDHLRNLRKSVPEDVIVTGYDYISPARTYTPTLTSVSHEWRPMGKRAFINLKKLMDNESIDKKITLDTRFMVGGSCGCKTNGKTLDRHSFSMSTSKMDPILVDSHFRHFYSAVKNSDTPQKIRDNFSYLFEREYTMEGKDFALYLNPDSFGFDATKEYTCVCNLENGKPLPLSEVSLKEALFNKANRSAFPGIYIFISLCTGPENYGFAMHNGIVNVSNDNQFYIWSRHMIQSLEQFQSNITIANLYKKMQILSVTDPLTGVYNRAGCESISYPMLIENAHNGKDGVIMLVDVDKMKIINDKYGHACGDQALKIIASTLTDSLPSDFIVSRFGGDEFFVAGVLPATYESFDTVIENMEENLAKKVSESDISFNLSMSVGYAKVTPSSTADIEKAIVIADNDMYERKKKHHQKMGY